MDTRHVTPPIFLALSTWLVSRIGKIPAYLQISFFKYITIRILILISDKNEIGIGLINHTGQLPSV